MKRSLIRSSVRAIALVLGLVVYSNAWAAVPTVAWDGDFDTTTKTGTDGATYTFALNPSGNSGESINVVTDGKLIIGSDSTYGGVISWPVDLSSATKMSVLIKYSSLDVADKGTAVLATATSYQIKAASPNNRTGIDDCVSMYAANGNKLSGRWNNNDGTYGGELANIVAPSGYLLMVYQSGSPFQFWTSSDGVTWSGGTATSLTFSDTYPNAVGLGGMTGLATATPSRFPKMSGMTIEAVAIYRGVALTVAQARNCHFDSEYTTQNYKKWAYANSVLSYNMAQNADIGSSSTKVKCFNIATGANVGNEYSGGGDTVYFGSVFWNSFCCHQSAYSAPGCVLRVAGAYAVSAGFNKSTQGPLTLGGLIVESSADGCTFPGTAQSTVLGSASASSETWFGIKGNATINRTGFLILSGNVNIDVAEGKTFNLNASQTTDANYPTIKANVTAGLTGTGDDGGVLRMHGLGTITVPTLIASNEATLDFSDVQASETVVRGTTPFIQGNLTVDATTKLILPSGTAENAAYVLCSGTLTAPTKTVQTTVQIGDDEAFTGYVTYDTTTKSVSYSMSAPSYIGTVDGTSITWNVEDLTNDDIAGANITLTGSGEVTLPAEPISINAGSDVTVDVTGYTTAAYSGEGTFKYTSGYPTTVPAGMTYKYVGSDDVENPAVLDNATVSGTLLTSGQLRLRYYSQVADGAIDVLSGCTKLGSNIAVNGTVTVRPDAELEFTNGDAVNYNATTLNLNIYGTLTCGAYRQSVPTTARITFYTGSTITGSGDGSAQNDSTFDLLGTADILTFSLADGAENGTVNFNAPVSLRGSAAVTWTVDSGVTVDWAGDATKGCTSAGASDCNGSVKKAGSGTLKLSGVMHKGSVTLNAGTLDVAATQAVTVTYGAASAAMTASNGAVVTGTITAAANGSAFIAPDTSMQTFLKDSTKWQGTFSIPACSSTSTGHLQLPLHNYGNTSSVIALAGVSNQSNSYGTWISGNNDTVNATVQLNGNVTFNQGSSGRTYTFKKITGTGNLTIAAFSACTADGLGYVFDEINGYTGTITANNNSSAEACTFSVKIKNIVSSTTPLVKLTVGGTNEKTTIDLSEATVGGESVAVGLATNNGVSGIYLAVATYNGTSYFSLAEAIKAAGDENLADIVVADSSAEVPEGYALVGGTKVRKGGGEIYWTDGTYWAESGGNAVFSTAASGGETTTYVVGDTVVIPDTTTRYLGAIGDGAKLKYDCNGTITIYKSGDIESALKNAEVTVAAGTTLQFAKATWSGTPQPEIVGCSFAGEGAITVPSETTLAVSGNVSSAISFGGEGTVNVASDATLAFSGSATVSSTLAGSGEVSFATLPASALTLGDWTGTVELLPELNADQEYQLNNYGKTGSTIRINGLSAGWLAVDDTITITVNANLELAGDWNLSAMSTREYDFATVSGTGNMSFATAQHQPTSINIDTLSGYTGIITNNTEATLTIGTLALDSGADVSAGAKLLSTGGRGVFSVTAVTVGGEARTLTLSYRSDGVYVRASVASYNGVEYETIAEAIAAAVNAGGTYTDVTILDANATCPDGYYVDTENSNALTLYQAAIIQNNEGAMTTNYFTTAQLAVDALEGAPYTYSYYSHFEVYSGTSVAMTVDPSAGSGALWTAFSVKVKCLNGATVAVAMIDSTEYELTAGTADDNGIVTYTKTDKATTYVWAGATSDSASTSKKNYARADNWKVGTSSGATATRAPSSLDTVVFENGAYASTTASQSVAAMQVSGAVTISGGGSLTSASAITLGASDSITITGTLSPDPTAADTTNYRVRKTTADGTTTYTVVDKVGTIFSVY